MERAAPSSLEQYALELVQDRESRGQADEGGDGYGYGSIAERAVLTTPDVL